MAIKPWKLPSIRKFFTKPIYICTLAVIVILSCWLSVYSTGWGYINFRQIIDTSKIFGNTGNDSINGKKSLTLPELREVALQLLQIQRNLESALSRRQPPKFSDIVAIRQLATELYPQISTTDVANDAAGNDWWHWSKAENNSSDSPLVCPEVYDGPKSALGWRQINCTTKTSFKDLLTVVINADEFPVDTANDRLLQLLNDFHVSYPDTKVLVIGVPTNLNLSSVNFGQSVVFLDANNNSTTKRTRGVSNWSVAFRQVHTPMTLVARDVHRFSESASSLERLVRVLSETPGVGVTGGAVRNSSRHWMVGCFQTRLRNYVLRYRKGYHSSHKECMLCDYVDGPFVTYTYLLHSVLVPTLSEDSYVAAPLAFQEFFLTVSADWVVMLCPDVMFYADSTMAGGEAVLRHDTWLHLAIKLELNRVLIEYERSHVLHKFSCSQLGIMCQKKVTDTASYTMPVCCQEEVARGLQFWDKFCSQHRLNNQYDSGTCLGAVKMSDMLPWDLDLDASYPDDNYTFVKSTVPLFRKHGLELRDFADPVCCDAWYPNRLKRSYMRIWSSGIYTEMWGDWNFPYDSFLYPDPKSYSNPVDLNTRVEIHGVWVNSVPNPGKYSRIRYGRECLKHAQSWLQTGKISSWEPYESGSFAKCKNRGHHACLDKFPADGSLAFRVPEW